MTTITDSYVVGIGIVCVLTVLVILYQSYLQGQQSASFIFPAQSDHVIGAYLFAACQYLECAPDEVVLVEHRVDDDTVLYTVRPMAEFAGLLHEH